MLRNTGAGRSECRKIRSTQSGPGICNRSFGTLATCVSSASPSAPNSLLIWLTFIMSVASCKSYLSNRVHELARVVTGAQRPAGLPNQEFTPRVAPAGLEDPLHQLRSGFRVFPVGPPG